MARVKWDIWSEGVISGVKDDGEREKMRENIAIIKKELESDGIRRSRFTRSGPHDVVEEKTIKQIAAQKGIDLKLETIDEETEENLHQSNGYKHSTTRR